MPCKELTVKRVPHHYPDPLAPDRVRRDVVLATLSTGQVDMVDHHCLSVQVYGRCVLLVYLPTTGTHCLLSIDTNKCPAGS